jgi:hypothetical protein
MALKKIEDSEKTLPPQSIGTYPPTIDPMKSPVMMKVLDIGFYFILIFYHKPAGFSIQKNNPDLHRGCFDFSEV